MMPANNLMRLLMSALAVGSCLIPPVGGQGTSTSDHVVERHPVCGYSYEPRFLTINATLVSLAMLGVDPRDFDKLENPNSGFKDQIFIPATATDCANTLEWNNFIKRDVEKLCPQLSFLSTSSVYNYNEYENVVSEPASFKSGDDVMVGSRRLCTTSSSEFASSVDDDEEKLVQFFQGGGEVVLAEARCQTHTVSVNLNTRPTFTPNFHRALRKLSFAAENPDVEKSRKAFSDFIEAFGTHYQDTTHFGSRLLIMKLFAKKATSTSEKNERHRCVSWSFTQNLREDSSFNDVVEHFNRDVMHCDSKGDLDNLNSLGLTPTRILTVGAIPLPDLDQTLQRPVPIHYRLEKIHKMFQEEWFDWLECSVDGAVMQKFFDNMKLQEHHASNGTSCARKVGCGYNDNCDFGEKCVAEQHSQRGHICVSTKPGRAVILGGRWSSGTVAQFLRTVEQVNLESFPELPAPISDTAAATSGQHVVVCGGEIAQRGPTNVCHKISFSSPGSGWKAMPSAPIDMLGHTAVSISQSIVWFIYGRQLFVFDSETQRFSTLNLPLDAKSFHCSVSNDTHAYIVGAGDNKDEIWVNKYPMDGTKWQQVARIMRSREYHACLWYGSNIMITGGMRARSDVEMFNTETGEVWAGKPLLTGRHGHQMMLLDGNPTVLGGRDNNGEYLGTFESFSLESNRWEKLERTLTLARGHFTLVEV